MLWGMSSWFTHVPGVPAFIFSGVGEEVKLSMTTCASAATAMRLPITTMMPVPSTRRKFLAIVRNAFMTWVKENRSGRMMFVPDTPVADNADKEESMWGSRPRDPESLLLESIDSQTLSRLMEQLPAEYREVLLLREVEDLAYKEIAEVTGMPIGTVMSRLSRARLSLRKLWLAQAETEDAHGV